MKEILTDNCVVKIKKNDRGFNEIKVVSKSENYFINQDSCQTAYPLDLIEKILEVKGPAYLCDEIMREEDTNYVQTHLEIGLLSTITKKDNLRILDFGCGSGSSTIILNRLFPNAKIIGVELEEKFVSICNARRDFYDAKNIEFILSPNQNVLPDNIGDFDIVILSAVFEHLLPKERKTLFPVIFSHLKTNGILYLDQTPHRYWPFESHTTGLPLINFLPDKVTHFLTKKFSKRNIQDCSWNELLRKGIRGSTVSEINRILVDNGFDIEIITPFKNNLRSHIDLWYRISSNRRASKFKYTAYQFIKMFKLITGYTLIPSITLSIKRL